MKTKAFIAILLFFAFTSGYGQFERKIPVAAMDSALKEMVKEFAVVKLTTDLTNLTDKEKEMIPYLFEAARIMDDLFWDQALGNKEQFMSKLKSKEVRQFANINYGPWERLNGNISFVEGYGAKPLGANFYPADMTKEEFGNWKNSDKYNQYSLVRRNPDRSLKLVMYHEAYMEGLKRASDLLLQASKLAEDPGLKKYLELRSAALVTDEYFQSDMAWMDMKTNTLDVVIGPIENYEDELFGIRTAYESAVLVKDKEWSKKLEKYTAFLPELQSKLPVDEKYRKEKPGTASDLNVYDVIYVAGHSNAGSKTIAINLPNDEKVQLEKGSRRLQLKNAMKAKFDNILVPISDVMIEKSQRSNIKFDAFFSNVMFHEVAHGLGVKNTINGKGTVREALKEKYSSFEEAKADILGLYMVTMLIEKGEITGITMEDCFVTYMAGLIRSVRFGAASSHGKANMMCFNFFAEKGAFERLNDGYYKVNMDNFRGAMNEWASKVLMFEGNGDYSGASSYLEKNGRITPELQQDLAQLRKAQIPVDIVYDQGLNVLGLKQAGQGMNQTGPGDKSGEQEKKNAPEKAPERPKVPSISPIK
jgi:hypothetical protein